MRLVAVAAGLVALIVAAVRWARVSQREHYIAGSCLAVARRWLVAQPVNIALVVLGVAGAIVSFTGGSTVQAAAAIVVAIAGGVFPLRMSVLGKDRSRLRWTRRAIRLTGALAVLCAAVVAVIGLLTNVLAGLSIAVLSTVALVDLAAFIVAPFERRTMRSHRDRAEAKLRRIGPTVIAVTGSWGKTSTKNHIRDLLADFTSVVASPASFNNTGGLARTINDYVNDDCEVLVAEMGMYGPGEIRELCSWIPPDIAVICAIGPMHLERVGSIEGIVAAKAEILERAKQAVLWVSNEYLAALADRVSDKRVWRVGLEGTPDLDVEIRPTADGLAVLHEGRLLGTSPSDGGVHPENLGCAVAAALAYGIDEKMLARRIAALGNPEHRASTAQTDRGVWVVDDTFNSNPAGASRALDLLCRFGPGQRVVVTPGMIELGQLQFDANRKFAGEIVSKGATLVIVGRTNRRALLAGSDTGRTICVANRDQARNWVRGELGTGDAVLWENDLPDHYP
jgi:UDP-N-acetylmuramoyl-tripeptide--D-alanyl-D-alanine ligase